MSQASRPATTTSSSRQQYRPTPCTHQHVDRHAYIQATRPLHACQSPMKLIIHDRVLLTGSLNTTTNVLRPFFRDHPGEPVPEENFWTLWCKWRLTDADTPTIRMGTTPFFTGQMPFLLPSQQCQSTEGICSLNSYCIISTLSIQ